jgi:hypothetical protein
LEVRAHVARVFSRGFEKRLRIFEQAMRTPGAGRRWLVPGMILETFRGVHAKEKVVQQHSGDWTMTGKVPVARVRGSRAFTRNQPEG